MRRVLEPHEPDRCVLEPISPFPLKDHFTVLRRSVTQTRIPTAPMSLVPSLDRHSQTYPLRLKYSENYASPDCSRSCRSCAIRS